MLPGGCASELSHQGALAIGDVPDHSDVQSGLLVDR
jgi:hypothetical protein